MNAPTSLDHAANPPNSRSNLSQNPVPVYQLPSQFILCPRELLFRRVPKMLLEPLQHCGIGALEIGA